MKKQVSNISTDTYNLQTTKTKGRETRDGFPIDSPGKVATFEQLEEQFCIDDIYEGTNLIPDKLKEALRFVFTALDQSKKRADQIAHELDKRIEYINANINVI